MSLPHPDARTFAADRLLENERMALAIAAGSLALLVTQVGTIAASGTGVRALATLAFACFAYCCIWQVHIINYATFWLATERIGATADALPGRGLLHALRAETSFTEAGLGRLIRASTWHYSLSFWVGSFAGGGALMMVIWT
jgi:hypothetical protein